MSVLESMRSGTDSTLMQIVVAAVVVSFVGWGVGVQGNTTTAVATVNGEQIMATDFGRVFRIAEQEQSARSKAGLTEDDREALREQVLQQMVRQRALVQEAKNMGLEVSNIEIAERLYTYTFLLDEDGVFEKRAYQNFLRRQGLTRASFEEQLRDQLLIDKLQGLMILGASVSETMVEQEWIKANTKIEVEFVRIRPGQFAATVEPDAEELATWIAENGGEIQARYEDDKPAKYDIPEMLTLRMIRINVRDDDLGVADLKPKLDAVKALLDGGADFATMARTWSEHPSAELGGLMEDVRVPNLPEDEQQALAALEPGQMTGVMASERDVKLYQLVEREAARVIPLEEVEEAIAQDLVREIEGPAKAARFAELELLPSWQSAGTPPEELLASRTLRVQTTGLIGPNEGGLLRPPEEMMAAAQLAEPGEVLGEVFEDNGVLWVGAVKQRQDAELETLEEKREEITEQVLLSRRIEFFQGWVDDVVARAKVVR